MSIKIRKHSKLIFSLIVIIFISVLCISKVFYSYELTFYDILFKIRPPLKTSPSLVIIEISDDTLKNLGQWPLPRDFHASLVDVLGEFKVKMVIFDMFFSEPSEYDAIFSESIEKADNVFIPQVLDISNRVKHTYNLIEAKTKIADVSLLKGVFEPVGHINTFVDLDGKIRAIPLFIKYNKEIIPQLSLNAACKYLGIDISRVTFNKDEVIIDNKVRFPVSFNNSFLVNYPGKWKDSFLHLSYFGILKAYKDIKEGRVPQLDLNILKDKVCIVGLTATGTPDIRANPLENSYPLVGLQASVFNSIVENKFIRELPTVFSILISILVLCLVLYISLRFNPLKAFLASTVLGLSYFFIAAILFIVNGLWLNIFLVFTIILVAYIASTIYKFIDEIKKREIIEKELEIARDIQRGFLPQDIKEFSSVKISCFMQPAKFVAGDLYDVIPLDDRRLGILIGDVAGKGASASLIMAQTVSLFRVFARNSFDPADVFSKLNKELCSILEGRFVTAFYLVIDTKDRVIKACCAGHNPLILYNSRTNEISEINNISAPPLGVLDITEFESFELSVNKNDRLFLYTDGLSEARNQDGQELGIDKVKQLIKDNKDLPVEQIISLLKNEISKFSRGLDQYDDITLILLGF